MNSLLEHYRERLQAAMTLADNLSGQVSDLLREGATLDDDSIVSLTAERAAAHQSIQEFRDVIAEETARVESQGQAQELLNTPSQQPSGWREPNPGASRGGDAPKPFENFGLQLQAIHRASKNPSQVHPGLTEIQDYAIQGLGEQIPSEGGFLVQTDFTDELLQLIHDTGIIVGLPRHIPIGANSNGLRINAIDESSRVDGSRLGGVQAFWTAEADTITKSKPTFRQIDLKLHKLAALYYATDEELADAPALEATLSAAFAEEMGFKLDDALIRGTGTGEPLGILGHAGTVTITAESGQAAKTVVVENIEKMFARLWSRSMANATWYINQDVWPQLFALEKAVGTGGVPVFLPAGGLSASPFGTLMGRQIMPLEQCETLGTKGDIIFGSFPNGYVMIDKGGLEAASSIHVEFLTAQEVFRFILRTDGQPISNKTLTPYKGTVATSNFIDLADRA